MESSQSVRLRIMTPEKTIYDEMVNHVILPAVLGEVGIFHHHTPFMSFLKPGRLQIHLQDQRIICVEIESGLFEFKDNSITILTTNDISIGDMCEDDTNGGERQAQENSAHEASG